MKFPQREAGGAVLPWLLTCLLCGVALAAPVRLLPLGDSLTAGQPSTGTAGAYRPELVRDLVLGGYEVDFLGTLRDDVIEGLPDPDHQGVNSARLDQLEAGLDGWLDVLPTPDVVLLMAGTNDLWQGADHDTALAREEQLLRHLAARCPYARLLVATLPLRTDQAALEQQQQAFNAGLATLVADLQREGLRLGLVEMHQVLTPEDLSADGVHPSPLGYQKIGQAWAAAVRQVIQPEGSEEAPEIVSMRAEAGLAALTVEFSKPVSQPSLLSCRIDVPPGHQVTAREPGADERSLRIALSPALAPGRVYGLAIGGVTDQSALARTLAEGTVATVATSAIENGSFEAEGSWLFDGNLGIYNAPVDHRVDGSRLLVFNAAQQAPNGVASQTVATVPGQDYLLEFEQGILGYQSGGQALRWTVMGDRVLRDGVVPMTTSGQGKCEWQRISQRITADSAATTLMWRDESPTSSDIDSLLDRIVMVPVVDSGMVNGDFRQGLFGWQASGNPPVVVSAPPYGDVGGEPVLVFNGGQSGVGGSLVQSFATQPGQTYALEYRAGAYGDAAAVAPALQMDLSGGPLKQRQIVTVAGTGFSAPVWRSGCWVFTAANRITTLRLSDASLATHNIDLLLSGLRLRPASTRSLRFEFGEAGGSVLVSPADQGGVQRIEAAQTLSYQQGSELVVTACATVGGSVFSHWLKDGLRFSAQRDLGVRLDADCTLMPVYVAGGGVNLLENGSFERGLAGWAGIGSVVAIDAVLPYGAADGQRVVVMNGGQTAANGHLQHTVATEAGALYELRFRAGVLSYCGGRQRLRVSISGGAAAEQEFSWSGPFDGGIAWQQGLMRFEASGTTVQLCLQDISDDGDVTDLLLDDLVLQQLAAGGGSDPVDGQADQAPRLKVASAATGLELELDVRAAGIYRVEASSNLRDWQAIGEITAEAAGVHRIAVGEGNGASRFFRVAWQAVATGE